MFPLADGVYMAGGSVKSRLFSPVVFGAAAALGGLLSLDMLWDGSFVDRAEAHARLMPGGVIMPRSNQDGLKTAPCGGVAAKTPTPLAPGQKLNIAFEETINHPGWYEIHLSTDGGSTFAVPLLKRLDDVQNAGVPLPHRYNVEVLIPDVTCTGSCVIQLIQVMTDRNPPTNYYSCADVIIKKDGVTVSPSPSPAATPSPSPQPAAVPDAPQEFKIEWNGGKP
jgi:Lytic polysaccharide mono-oxygenase, cellulose-degrading